tara:strand:+ start:1222 stop:2088 length:867 start_codon:yes stop_codon:yes gene_type:complete
MKNFFEIRENIKLNSEALGFEETSLNELTAAEKKLINQMYDKKGNLTPMGKKVMDHGKANSKLTSKNRDADNARRKEYNAYQKSKRNEEVDLDENAMLKMKLINKMKKASPAAKKALEAPSRVDKKKESVEETKSGKSLDEISVKDLANQVMMKSRADAARKNRFKKADGIKTDLDRLRKGLKKYDMRPIKAQTEEKDPALKRAGVSGFNKPKRTPGHKSSSHIVVTKVDGKAKTIRFGQQGASTAGDPKEGESDKMKAKRKSFKARHGKNIAKGKSSAAYWADKEKW